MARGKIKLIDSVDMLCENEALATIANYWGLHYEMIFSDYWKFDVIINDTNHSVNQLVAFDNNENKYAKQYHNILINIEEYNQDTIEKFIKEIEIYPVFTLIQRECLSFSLPADYTDPYGALLVYEYDHKKDGFLCIDLRDSKQNEFISKESFIDGIHSIQYYQKYTKLKEKDNECMLNEELKNTSNAIKMFADHLEGFIEKNTSFFNTSFYFVLKNICRTRNLYPYTLEYVGEKYTQKELLKLAKQYSETALKWSYVFSLFTKCYIQFEMRKKDIRNESFHQIRQVLYEIAVEEENIINDINDIIDRDFIKKNE